MHGYRCCGATLASAIELPQLEPAAIADASCTIDVAAPSRAAPAEHRWFHRWRVGGGRPWLLFARAPEGYLLRFPDFADVLVSPDGAHLRVRPRAGVPADTLQHLLLDQVLPLALSRGGRLVLHASAVHVPGLGAIALAGRTGRGKSTLAAALAANGAAILADDGLVIERIGSAPCAQPAYPGLRLWPGSPIADVRRAAATPVAHYTYKRRVRGAMLPFRTDPSPLRALFLLLPRATRGPAATIRRSRGAARMMALVKHAYVLDIGDRDELSRVFDAVATLAVRVPVLTARVRHGGRWLAAAVEAIAARAAAEGVAHASASHDASARVRSAADGRGRSIAPPRRVDPCTS